MTLIKTGVEAQQNLKLTETNRPISLIYALKKFFGTNYNINILNMKNI